MFVHGDGAAKRRRERRLRAFQRYVRWTVAMEMANVRHHSYHKTTATGQLIHVDQRLPFLTRESKLVYHGITNLMLTLLPCRLTLAAPARMIEHVAPSPVIDYIASLSAEAGVYVNPHFLSLLWRPLPHMSLVLLPPVLDVRNTCRFLVSRSSLLNTFKIPLESSFLVFLVQHQLQ